MTVRTQDARLRELAFLARFETEPSVTLLHKDYEDSALRSLVIQLLHDGCINGLDSLLVQLGEPTHLHVNFGGKSLLQLKHEGRLWEDIGRVLTNQQVIVRISHRGRVRHSELEQALRTGRDREPFGVLWADRHREQAVTIAVLSAHPASAVSVAYLDMNGLKSINDGHDHHAGDVAIRTYLQTIAMLMGEKAEGFRGGSSDEVVVVMRDTSAEDACGSMRSVLKQLGKERVQVDGKEVVPFLSASCGIAWTTSAGTDAAALVRRADAEQQRAKKESKAGPRTSVLAVEGGDVERVV